MHKGMSIWVLLLLAWSPLSVATCGGGGDLGSGAGRDGPRAVISISTVEGLQDMNSDLKGAYELANDIDASATSGWNGGAGFIPIGTSNTGFSGTLDGRGRSIIGLVTCRNDQATIGLFGSTTSSAVIRDLRLQNIRVSMYGNTGGLAGYNAGTVLNCSVSGSVKGDEYVGGLVGWNDGTLANCTSACSASGNDTVGGLVGWNKGTVSACSSNGPVSGDEDIGGLAGTNVGTITGSSSRGTVNGDSSGAGGLVGINCLGGSISGCHSTGSVKGNSSYVGGLVGSNILGGRISTCFSTASVKGTDDDVGGLVGYNGGVSSEGGTISDCTSSGSVDGVENVGGLVGFNTGYGSISNCYSTGLVKGTVDAGGLVGYSNGPVSKCFWNNLTSGQSGSKGGTGKSTLDMMWLDTFEGWDFKTTWAVIGGKSYPFLRTCNLSAQGVKDAFSIMNRPKTTVKENESYSALYMAYSCEPGAAITWTLATNASWLALDPGSGSLSGTPARPDIGSYRVNVTASDGRGNSASQEFTLAVRPPSLYPPVWSKVPGNTELTAGENYAFTVKATDKDAGETLVFGLASDPPCALTMDSGSGAIEWSGVEVGTYAVFINATDGYYTVWHRFNLTVANKTSPPPGAPAGDAEIYFTDIGHMRIEITMTIAGTDASMTRGMVDRDKDGVVTAGEVIFFEINWAAGLNSFYSASSPEGARMDGSKGTFFVQKYDLTGAEGGVTSTVPFQGTTITLVNFTGVSPNAETHELNITMFASIFNLTFLPPKGFAVDRATGLDNQKTSEGKLTAKTDPTKPVLISLKKGPSGTAGASASGSSTPLLIAALAVIVIAAAGSGAGYAYMRKKRAREEEELLAKTKAEAVPWVSPEDNDEQKRQKEWAEYEKMYGQPHPDSPEGIRRKAMQAEASAEKQADTGPQPPQDGAEAPPEPAPDRPAPEPPAQDGQSGTEAPPAPAPDRPAPGPPAQERQSAPAPPQEGAPAEK